MDFTSQASPVPDATSSGQDAPVTCRCADWLSEGEARVVEFGQLRIVVRYVGRKGRRGRIVIEAPAGAAFS